jgi:hypothetical protein
MYNSSWEYSKSRSTYHFDKKIKDQADEWFWVLGKFKNTWSQDLIAIKEAARPMTWENRKFSMGRNGPVSAMLEQEEYDVVKGGGDPKMTLVDMFDDFDSYPNLKAIIDFFALEQSKTRLHVQRTGQVFNRHIDKLDDLYPGTAHDQIIRFAVMLEDWEPGQFYQYGNLMYENWTAGEVHYFDWPNVPHATANASSYPRYTLQITGVCTARTHEIIKSKNFDI